MHFERDIAEQERGKAVAITDFLHNMFFSINPDKAQGEVITVRQILDKASEKLNQDDSHTLFSQPLIEASVRRTDWRHIFPLRGDTSSYWTLRKSVDTASRTSN
ncbi:hypothetical protein P4S73_17005 [Paraglaciecola sp. Hal342]